MGFACATHELVWCTAAGGKRMITPKAELPPHRGDNTCPSPKTAAPQTSQLPLCVDLDGTLIAGDTTRTAVRLLVRQHRWQALLLLAWLLRGRAYLKQQLARRVQLDAACLHYNRAVLQLIETYRKQGNPIYLVTATDKRVAQQVCAHLNFFTDCYASDGVCNLRHKAKAALLCKTFGSRNFIYVGDSRADLAVWQQAHSAVIVSNRARLIAAARKISNVVGVLSPDTPE